MTSPPKNIAFLGASTGVGLSALRASLKAGHNCIALCRTPSKLTSQFPSNQPPKNLTIITGNAHSIDTVKQCLLITTSASNSQPHLVDFIITTIGASFIYSKLTIDDPNVCRKGASTLLSALKSLRDENGAVGTPLIIPFSTTGLSRFGRDIPLPCVPLYALLMKVPHEDKLAMEDLISTSGERFTIVRASLLTNGPASQKGIKVGIEDREKGVEGRKAIGYTISREDAGRWIFENLIPKGSQGSQGGGKGKGRRYENKIVSITY